MKKIALIAGLVAMSFSFIATPALADAGYSIQNNTGVTVAGLHMSPTNQTNWGGNILDGSMESGGSATITFHPDDTECMYDIKIVNPEGAEVFVTGIDLCKFHKVTFSVEGGKVVYNAE
ncbi:MAG: hypothetical protein H7338_18440 [Candidatus Sericytochromatia bacterium]|nr:hypothetical protein [Candidatus Sericytochromatia bacterium]